MVSHTSTPTPSLVADVMSSSMLADAEEGGCRPSPATRSFCWCPFGDARCRRSHVRQEASINEELDVGRDLFAWLHRSPLHRCILCRIQEAVATPERQPCRSGGGSGWFYLT